MNRTRPLSAQADREADTNEMACPLCSDAGEAVPGTTFLLCGQCRGFYRHARYRLGVEEERARYETHNNDVNDPGYRLFVSPVVSAVLKDFTPDHSGLDFGAGTGPVISKVLHEQGFHIVPYDPFFHYHPALLENLYDYIVCCEVVEHFYSPGREFALLKRLLKPRGRIYCMTHLYTPGADFGNWYYVRDPTHVFIYQSATMEWIRCAYDFSCCTIKDRLVTLVNRS
jgi:SAM-dependent methyltransferase